MDPMPAVAYGALTRCGQPFQVVRLAQHRAAGLIRFRSPLLAEPHGRPKADHSARNALLMSFPPGTEMFQFPGFASSPYVFRE